MILDPGILALLIAAALAAVLLVAAAALGARIALRWRPDTATPEQLALERLGSLVKSLAAHALGFQAVSIFLFVATADGIHPLLTGAMCATGSLNANPVGWWVLPVKLAAAGLAALWLVLDGLDRGTDTAPLLIARCRLLAPLALLALLDGFLQARYFSGLDPDVITSCCGSLFSEGGGGVAAELAALPPRVMRPLFFAHAALLISAGLGALARPRPATRIALAVVAALFLPVALASIVSFVSVSIYELPTHHCPFDMLQSAYRYVGYPLYAGLFGGVFFAALPGLLSPLRSQPALAAQLDRRERGWLLAAGFCILLFMALSTWPQLGAFTLDAGR